MLSRLLAETTLTVPLEVAGVWATTTALFSGAAAAWALFGGASRDDIARAAALGGAVGFIVGFGLAAAAAIYLYAGTH